MIRDWVDAPGRAAPRDPPPARAASRASATTSSRRVRSNMALARGRRERGVDYWPGFVDALSTLLLGIIFLLSVFVVVQFFLSQEVTGKDTALQRLNAQIAQLTDLLSLEKTGKLDARGADRAAAAPASPPPRASATASRACTRASQRRQRSRAGQGRRARQGSSTPRSRSRRARWRRSRCSTSRSRRCAASSRALEEALDASEKKDKESQDRIADLGQRLNVALAQRVQELSRYRSDFFGRLRDDPRQPPGHPHRRRPLRVPVGSVLRHRPGDAASRKAAPSSTSSRPR